MKLTEAELRELIWYISVVQSWGAGGPYGDSDEITDKKSFARMDKILAKLKKEASQ